MGLSDCRWFERRCWTCVRPSAQNWFALFARGCTAGRRAMSGAWERFSESTWRYLNGTLTPLARLYEDIAAAPFLREALTCEKWRISLLVAFLPSLTKLQFPPTSDTSSVNGRTVTSLESAEAHTNLTSSPLDPILYYTINSTDTSQWQMVGILGGLCECSVNFLETRDMLRSSMQHWNLSWQGVHNYSDSGEHGLGPRSQESLLPQTWLRML